MDSSQQENRALQLVESICNYAVEGVGPLDGASELATTYRHDGRYASNEARIDSLIRWETAKNFTSGFVTGLGGIMILPVSIPAALGAAWAIQARLIGSIAILRGYELEDDRVRTLMIVSLAGDAGKEAVKRAGIDLSRRAGTVALGSVPGHVLIEINKRVGFRLLTKAGTTGVVNLSKAIPVIGGVVGGSVDAAMCRGVAKAAKVNFPPYESVATAA